MGLLISKSGGDQLIDRSILVYDFEVFLCDWMIVAIDFETHEKNVICNDPHKLRLFYEKHAQDIWVGYNSRNYDLYILKGILLGYDPYYVNCEIIENGKKGYQVVKDANSILFIAAFGKMFLLFKSKTWKVDSGICLMEGKSSM